MKTFLLLLFSAVAALASPSAPRSLYELDLPWTNDSGAAFSLGALWGRPVVIAMIFSRCSGICPVTVAQMRQLEGTLPAGVRARARFVLVSFDSANDTSAVLHAYRRRMGLEEPNWILLRGSSDSVRQLSAALGVSYTDQGDGRFVHTGQITVLNAEGDVAFQRASLDGAMETAARAVDVAAGD